MPMLTMLRMRLAGVAAPGAAAHAIGEVGHAVEHRVDPGHDVFAVNQDRLPLRRAQRYVQDGPLLGHVDLLAREHRIDPRAQPGLFGELQQQIQRFVGDAVLRVVEIDSRRPRPSVVRRARDLCAKSSRRCKRSIVCW